MAAVSTLLVGCGPALAGGASLLLGVIAFVGLLLSVERRAAAGPPVPCSGYEVTLCSGGYLRKSCCPKGSKCNFQNPPHIECGNGYCVEGADRGRCPAPQPQIDTNSTAASCAGAWQPVCLDHHVKQACVAPYHTNYTGPSHNPAFKTCLQDRCTTSPFVEDCYPTKAELGGATCAGKWTQVCLGGKAVERCLPTGANATEFPATRFTTCKDASCVVGDDRAKCP